MSSSNDRLPENNDADNDIDEGLGVDSESISPEIETAKVGVVDGAESDSKNADKHDQTIWERLHISRRRRYVTAAVFNLALIWGVAITFVTKAPNSYVSNFTLLIPGAGAGSSVNLDNLGQATSSVNSAYSSSKIDPKTNYKAIAMSPVVIGLAAEYMDLAPEEFGKPKIKLIDQTTLLEVSVTATDSQTALQKSTNFHKALEETLSRLRTEELRTRRQANETVLSVYRDNVDLAQAAVLAFQQESAIVSSDQFEDLVLNTEGLKQRTAESEVKLQSVIANLTNLQDALDINSDQAAVAIKLQNNAVFLSMVEKVADAQSELVEKLAVWGQKHPQVLHAQSRVNSARRAILSEANRLTGLDTFALLDNLYITSDGVRSQLFQSVISMSAEKSALESEIDAYSAQIRTLEGRLHRNAILAAKLQDLERTHQVTSAIYVSAAAKTDLGNSDIYASYPMTQLLREPSLPEEPEKFAKPAAIGGAAIGSFLVCLALLLSWKRSVLLQKLQKKS